MAQKKCTICGKEYHHCSKCEKIVGYRFYADTPECYQIFTLLREYREGIFTIEETAKKFNNIGIKSDDDMTDFIPAVQRDIKTILASVKKSKKKSYDAPLLAESSEDIDEIAVDGTDE